MREITQRIKYMQDCMYYAIHSNTVANIQNGGKSTQVNNEREGGGFLNTFV